MIKRAISKLLFTVLLIIYIIDSCFATNPNSVIVANAIAQIGESYQEGQPPNKDYIYGAVFDIVNWTGGFDCSGLVSYAGNLRRHYSSEEIISFTTITTWNNIQSGDVFYTSGHIMIFDGHITESGVAKLKVIESVGSTGVREHVYINPEDINYGDDCYLAVNNYVPYHFRSDSSSPVLTILGSQNEGVFNSDITVSFIARDNIQTNQYDPYAYAEYQGTRFLTKTFSADGVYNISFHAEDWVKNTTDTLHKITIDSISPEITVTDSLNRLIPSGTGGTQDTYLCVSASDTATGLAKLEIYKDGNIWFQDSKYCGYLREDGLYTVKACDKVKAKFKTDFSRRIV
ncbi:MAG: hypothetical protein L6420_09150 [Elusimicrobia bacterium]|nr:hypothetical protein [Elusimicrobiota bacterium]